MRQRSVVVFNPEHIFITILFSARTAEDMRFSECFEGAGEFTEPLIADIGVELICHVDPRLEKLKAMFPKVPPPFMLCTIL